MQTASAHMEAILVFPSLRAPSDTTSIACKRSRLVPKRHSFFFTRQRKLPGAHAKPPVKVKGLSRRNPSMWRSFNLWDVLMDRDDWKSDNKSVKWIEAAIGSDQRSVILRTTRLNLLRLFHPTRITKYKEAITARGNSEARDYVYTR
jgi:hypothetical protein